MSSRREQRELIKALESVTGKMSREDFSAFEMLRKRDRDDEELDVFSQRRLRQLADTYLPKKSKVDPDALLKKYIDQQKKSE
ncbi:MAG TPA: hypothetical protein VNN76_00360 [Bacteroidota bacterium]|nr:hypothetical protein [Bacteroidota bacterium]